MPYFSSHYIVLETGAGTTYYDPSYGSAAQATHQAWEANATDGLKKRTGLPAPNVGFIKGVLPAPATVLVLTPYNFPIY